MYLEKVSKKELDKIFKNSTDRSTFISTYPYLGTDNNNKYYKDFINANISNKKYKLQEDAIELSLCANIFNLAYVDIIDKIIHSRRTPWIKLLCLDWLNFFFDKIPLHLYNDLNLIAKKHNHEFLKLQGMLNLMVFNPDKTLIEEALETVKASMNNTLYYRFIHSYIDNNLNKILPSEVNYGINNLITALF